MDNANQEQKKRYVRFCTKRSLAVQYLRANTRVLGLVGVLLAAPVIGGAARLVTGGDGMPRSFGQQPGSTIDGKSNNSEEDLSVYRAAVVDGEMRIVVGNLSTFEGLEKEAKKALQEAADEHNKNNTGVRVVAGESLSDKPTVIIQVGLHPGSEADEAKVRILGENKFGPSEDKIQIALNNGAFRDSEDLEGELKETFVDLISSLIARSGQPAEGQNLESVPIIPPLNNWTPAEPKEESHDFAARFFQPLVSCDGEVNLLLEPESVSGEDKSFGVLKEELEKVVEKLQEEHKDLEIGIIPDLDSSRKIPTAYISFSEGPVSFTGVFNYSSQARRGQVAIKVNSETFQIYGDTERGREEINKRMFKSLDEVITIAKNSNSKCYPSGAPSLVSSSATVKKQGDVVGGIDLNLGSLPGLQGVGGQDKKILL